MFNIIKDEFEEDIEDIMNTVNKIINEKDNSIERQKQQIDSENK